MKDLLGSRKFWAAVFMVMLVVLSGFFPSFSMDAEHAASLAVVIVAYLVGVAVDPGPGGWKGVLQSRKFWAATIGLAIVFLDGFGIGLPMGFTQDQLVLIAVTIGGYISSVAFEKKLLKVTADQVKVGEYYDVPDPNKNFIPRG
jgi:ABC-type Na+ efflux pump permease subunit